MLDMTILKSLSSPVTQTPTPRTKSATTTYGYPQMKDSQLQMMTAKELRELRDRVDGATTAAMVRDRTELKAKITALAADHGLSLQDVLGGGKGRKSSGPVAIKFQNPKNLDEVWSGRGRRPLWMTKLGGDAERFRVG